MDAVALSEVFGPTVQGEGPSAGQRATFVRLGRCNLACSWCDTPYTWDWRGLNGLAYDPNTELHHVELRSIVLACAQRDTRLVVVTGGEPLLQQHALVRLAEALVARGHRVEVETNGTLVPLAALSTKVALYVVSPKLANAGMDQRRRIHPDALRAFEATGHAVLKFVVREASDFDEADEVRALVPTMDAWAMPEGRNAITLDQRMRKLVPIAVERGYHVTQRLHVQLWGDQRGH